MLELKQHPTDPTIGVVDMTHGAKEITTVKIDLDEIRENAREWREDWAEAEIDPCLTLAALCSVIEGLLPSDMVKDLAQSSAKITEVIVNQDRLRANENLH